MKNTSSFFWAIGFCYIAFALPAMFSFAGPRESSRIFSQESESVVVVDKTFHLGNDSKNEWKEFTTIEPHDERRLRLTFVGSANADEAAIEVTSGEVGVSWVVRLNQERLGVLKRGTRPRKQYFRVPPGALSSGDNELVIENESETTDDIHVGPVVLHRQDLASLLHLARVRVVVRDADSAQPVPCRITVTRPRGRGDDVEFEELIVETGADDATRYAVRGGVVYAAEGSVDLLMPEGTYRVYATRGFEYGLAEAELRLAPDENKTVSLSLNREVDTTGYLAADTHIHTLTHSGHGDATTLERLVSIAGEGVEIPIATDHNYHTDFQSLADEGGIGARFQSIIGTEFTTSVGHFNAFPVDVEAPLADDKLEGWRALVEGLRQTPGVRVVICNHPRRPSFEEGPWGKLGLNPISGELPSGSEWLGVDALEVVNANELPDEPLANFSDWFALLNRGHRLAAVAGSDSHTIDQPVGQARTYVKSPDDDPKQADIEQISENFRAGRLLLSLGLMVDATLNTRFQVGDLAELDGDVLDVEIEVVGPRWVRADRVAVFLNGTRVWDAPVSHEPEDIIKFSETVRLPAPPQDAHLVVIATGPALQAPYWPFSERGKYVLGATNPVWIDGDGDGRFTSANGYAQLLIEEHEMDVSELRQALVKYDESVAIQLASLLRRRLEERTNQMLQYLIDPEVDGGALEKYLKGAKPNGDGRSMENRNN